MTHNLAICKRRPGSDHYHTKSHSFEFICPACDRRGRFNMNYLGQRIVECDGEKFIKREAVDREEWKAGRQFMPLDQLVPA